MSATAPALNCNELVELVTDYLEGALPESERLRVEQHLEGCDGCRTYLEQIRQTIALSGRVRAEDLDPRMRDRLLDAFRGWERS